MPTRRSHVLMWCGIHLVLRRLNKAIRVLRPGFRSRKVVCLIKTLPCFSFLFLNDESIYLYLLQIHTHDSTYPQLTAFVSVSSLYTCHNPSVLMPLPKTFASVGLCGFESLYCLWALPFYTSRCSSKLWSINRRKHNYDSPILDPFADFKMPWVNVVVWYALWSINLQLLECVLKSVTVNGSSRQRF